MVRPKIMARLLWLCSVLLLLGACGGGGSSSPAGQDDSNPPLASQDQDMDGIADASDNCPAISNAGQSDLDNNGIGDDCDNNCGNSLTTVQPYACRIAGLGEGTCLAYQTSRKAWLFSRAVGNCNGRLQFISKEGIALSSKECRVPSCEVALSTLW